MASTKNILKRVEDYELSILEEQLSGKAKIATIASPIIFGAIGGILGEAFGDGLSGAFTGAAIGAPLGFVAMNAMHKLYNVVRAAPCAIEKLRNRIKESNINENIKRIADFELKTLKKQFDWGSMER